MSPLQAERERRGWSRARVASEAGISEAQLRRIEADGVGAAKTPDKLVRIFGNAITLDQVCNPQRYLQPVAAEQVA